MFAQIWGKVALNNYLSNACAQGSGSGLDPWAS